MYYTTDGSTPTTASATYAGSITVSATTTVKSIAVASGYTASPVSSATYTISTPTAATPTFSPAAGNYTAAQSVTLADSTAGATMYYTTNGAAPTTASATYGGSITVSATTTVKAIAVASGYTNSAASSATYTISVPTAAKPTFSPVAGTYTAAQSVTLADTTAGASIYYTTDGSTPTTASAVYAAAISVSSATTIKAIAVAAGYTNSAASRATYTISAPTAATPTVSPAAGTYTTAQSVTLADTTSGAVIYYTTDGSTPTIASAMYSAALSVNATTIVKAVAAASGYATSAVSSATYTISASGSPVSTPVSLAPANVYAVGNNGTKVTNGGIDTWGYAFSSSLLGSTVTWSGVTFNLGTTGTLSAASNSTIALPAAGASALNLLAVAVNGSHQNQVFVVTYTDGTTATYKQSLSDWVSSHAYAGESIAATMAYRIDQYGVIDNRAVDLYGYSFAIDATKTVKSLMLPASRNIVVLAVTLSTTPVSAPATAAAPTLSPGTGSYSSAQTVTMADTVAGAVIYYTTDGSTPTTASALYSTPLAITATTTVQAIAAATGYTNSAVSSANYTISVPLPAAAAPTLSQATGTYSSAQTITLADTTPGAAIYYTTNGSTPTAASALYSTPLTITATTTVKAIAVAGGYTNSAVSSANYTISGSTSTGSSPVSLTAAFNVDVIGTNGSPVTNGGIDTWGYAFSSNLLGSSVTWAGVTFNLGAAGTASAVSNATITLPAVQSTTLNLLATAVNGSHKNQIFVVTYTDGTTTTITQSVSDWYSPQSYAGESIAVAMAYRINQYGVVDNHLADLYGYSFAIDATKTVKSLTLPASRNIVVLAVAL